MRATDVGYPLGGEAQARIPAPGLSPLRVFFPLASPSLFSALVSARRAFMWHLPSVCYLLLQVFWSQYCSEHRYKDYYYYYYYYY